MLRHPEPFGVARGWDAAASGPFGHGACTELRLWFGRAAEDSRTFCHGACTQLRLWFGRAAEDSRIHGTLAGRDRVPA